MSKQELTEFDVIVGFGHTHVNQNTAEFKALKAAIIKASQEVPAPRRIRNHLYSQKLKMEDYLKKENPPEIIEVGTFLRRSIEALNITKAAFAAYIGYKDSNLSAVMNGTRKVSKDLALKLGSIFYVSAAVWLQIQSKNELLAIMKEDREKYAKYQLADLLRE